MQYFGGKARLAPRIVPVLQSYVAECPAGYWEPFCGGLNTFHKVQHDYKVASDACEPLIRLYQHIQQYGGDSLPDHVSEAAYRSAKAGYCEPWEQAFIGFGCSFAGKWFGGYARGGEFRSYARNAKSSLKKKFETLHSASFFASTYATDITGADYPWLIYCDPPYSGTTGYSAVDRWESAPFWEWTQCRARRHVVLVSEYRCPVPHRLIAEWPHRTDIRTPKTKNQTDRVERLFQVLPK